jgi:membrane protein YqaA with SNARE-associated domain
VGRRLGNGLALFWGFAEATVFFVVPDVLLSWFALDSPRRALRACLFALWGALIGGSIVWLAGLRDPEPLRAVYAVLPAIDAAMIDSVGRQLESQGLPALLLGPLKGTPYKIYALEAAHLGLGYLPFLLISVPARLVRFALVAVGTAAIGRLLRNRLSLASLRYFLILGWIAFYAWYFHAIG